MAYKYVGTVEMGFLSGVPARDLTNEEVRDLGPDVEEEIKASSLYQRIAESRLPQAPSPAPNPVHSSPATTSE